MLLRGPVLTHPCCGPGSPRFAVRKAGVPSLLGYPELQEPAGQRAVSSRELDTWQKAWQWESWRPRWLDLTFWVL